MTQEIIEMARDSGMELYGLGKDRARFVHHLESFAKLVAKAEREACAKVCEELEDDGGEWDIQQQCANAIRAWGQT